ncbi:biotin carboxylase N-terminal domain-containing protein [Paucilactobacillus nenjiangensis]|jgi:acetyl-CoA carboxylase biotin carboxylase subunit|uniref:biotin carboxylase n=1 Tax=Paucilactobacillus nenjiangensis TaxID=1296540 RepID=A0A5P1X579_9LACO|nr:biotin carboxylase N-terminal domain-containing protein [Paucilactobacillus nenjiangensis]QER68044.1 ATP-grasp domain-containing protein [Paucilactobacillus nenjiangensis]
MFKKVLIANRGEIACRLIRACQQLNIKTVAVYSTVDKDATFVQMADEAFCIGSSAATASYLNREAVLMAGVIANVDAIHPGYGFLAEDGMFVQMCEQCGIQWLGPRSEIIALMGDKASARKFAASRGVAIIPGTQVIDDTEKITVAATKLGFPLLIKASRGGGGKGIKKVTRLEELDNMVQLAKGESQSAFANGEIYLEKVLTQARHIEIQIIGDQKGHIQILGDRDCTLQIGRQKVIEESTATFITGAQRRELGQAVHQLLDGVGYQGLGTVEFLFCEDRFYFLEMNTRLQVEHGVTEATSGLDVVLLQLQLASGQGKIASENTPTHSGVAIEARISMNLNSKEARLDTFEVPADVRVDTGYQTGDKITPYYDALLAKLIVHGETRMAAIQKMQQALSEVRISGIDTNLELLQQIMDNTKYQQNSFTIETLDAGMVKQYESLTS